jgi:dipeptidyl aminopeptidase/acylaminoacyl peptidase
VADFSGPSDLSAPIPPVAAPLVKTVFGTADPGAAALRAASPTTYVSKDAPPFLIVHGDADPIVPPDASRVLYERLSVAGVPATLIVVRNGGHDLRRVSGHAETDPTGEELTRRLIQFFDAALARHDSNR